MNKYSDKKIVWFPDKMKSFVNKDISAPIYVRIKPTNKCQHKCPHCIYHEEVAGMHGMCNRTDEIPFDKLNEIIYELHSIGVKAITFSGGGEPSIYPRMNDLLYITKRYGLKYSMITNGQNLKNVMAGILDASWIRVSMDYWDKKSFSEARGLSEDKFTEVIQGIAVLASVKNNCDLGVNFIINNKNYHYMYEITALLASIGVENIRFAPLWIKGFYDYHSKIHRDVSYYINKCKDLQSDTFKVYSSYSLLVKTEREQDICYANQMIPVIGADLNVYTCHNGAYSKKHLIGSIKEKSFKDLWFSDETRQYFNNFNAIYTCTNMQCAADNKNKFIHELLDIEGDPFV